MTGFDLSWIQWKAIKVPSWSAKGGNVPCACILSTKRQKIRSISEVQVPDNLVGISIIWFRPKLLNSCGAVVSSGFGLKIGYLQYILQN